MTITLIDIVIIFCIIILFDFFFRNITDLLKSKIFHKKDINTRLRDCNY